MPWSAPRYEMITDPYMWGLNLEHNHTDLLAIPVLQGHVLACGPQVDAVCLAKRTEQADSRSVLLSFSITLDSSHFHGQKGGNLGKFYSVFQHFFLFARQEKQVKI